MASRDPKTAILDFRQATGDITLSNDAVEDKQNVTITLTDFINRMSGKTTEVEEEETAPVTAWDAMEDSAEEEEALAESMKGVIPPLRSDATHFHKQLDTKKRNAAPFNSNTYELLTRVLANQAFMKKAQKVRKAIGLDLNYTTHESRSQKPMPITGSHALVAYILFKGMLGLQAHNLYLNLPCSTGADNLEQAKAVHILTMLLNEMVVLKYLEYVKPTQSGDFPRYFVKDLAKYRIEAIEAVTAGGIILEDDGVVKGTGEYSTFVVDKNGEMFDVGQEFDFSCWFISCAEETLKAAEKEFNDKLETAIGRWAIGSLTRIALEETRAPSVFSTMAEFPSTPMRTIKGICTTGREVTFASAGESSCKTIRRACKFRDGSFLHPADGVTCVMTLSAIATSQYSPGMNLDARADGKTQLELLQLSQKRDELEKVLIGEGYKAHEIPKLLKEAFPYSRPHQDPYYTVGQTMPDFIQNELISALLAVGIDNPSDLFEAMRTVIKRGATPTFYNAGVNLVTNAILREVSLTPAIAAELAAVIRNFRPCKKYRQLIGTAKNPSATFTSPIVEFVYPCIELDGSITEHTLTAAHTLDNAYIGNVWTWLNATVYRDSLPNVEKAQTALAACTNQWFESFLLKFMRCFAQQRGFDLFSTHDEIATPTEVLTRQTIALVPYAARAIQAQAMPLYYKKFGIYNPPPATLDLPLDCPVFILDGENDTFRDYILTA